MPTIRILTAEDVSGSLPIDVAIEAIVREKGAIGLCSLPAHDRAQIFDMR